MDGGKLRWGILGLGRIADAFARGLASSKSSQLIACGSNSSERAEAFSRKWGVPKRHSSWEALAADPEVDAVYIATPHPMHKANALLCLESGKAVLCEKPFTINEPEARELVEASKRKGLLLMEGMWTRFLPHMELLRKLVHDGAIGEVSMVQADFGARSSEGPEGRIFNPLLGGGALLDIGVYTVSFAQMLLGEPVECEAMAKIGPTGVDERLGALLRFQGGAIASLSCSIVEETPQEATVIGSKGRIRVLPPWWGPSSLMVKREGKSEELMKPECIGNGYNYEAEEFARCAAAGLRESPFMTHSESLAEMRTMDELRKLIGLVYPMEQGKA